MHALVSDEPLINEGGGRQFGCLAVDGAAKVEAGRLSPRIPQAHERLASTVLPRQRDRVVAEVNDVSTEPVGGATHRAACLPVA